MVKELTVKQLRLLFILFTLCSLAPIKAEKVMEMIEHEHYPAQRHMVQTQDGYILGIYRIPKMGVQPTKRKVMLLMHGLTAAAPAYLTFGRKKSAAYFFSDAGYDVWIGNFRGNTYSRQHVFLNPDRPEFWNFSWHEMGIYDLPAMIDYILQATNQTQLTYVGHSQGVTAAFVMLSSRPEYNRKISVLHAMTPPVVFKYNHPLYPKSLEKINEIGTWLREHGFCELASHANIELIRTTAKLCMTPSGSAFCKYIILTLFGPSEEYYDRLLLDIINHIPAGAGYNQFVHYGQITLSGRFQQFDHGPQKNMKLYGSTLPPDYNLSNIQTKIHILYGTNDWLIPEANIPILVKKLTSNVVAVSKFDGFNHIDFTYARNLKRVHQKILKVLKRYH